MANLAAIPGQQPVPRPVQQPIDRTAENFGYGIPYATAVPYSPGRFAFADMTDPRFQGALTGNEDYYAVRDARQQPAPQPPTGIEWREPAPPTNAPRPSQYPQPPAGMDVDAAGRQQAAAQRRADYQARMANVPVTHMFPWMIGKGIITSDISTPYNTPTMNAPGDPSIPSGNGTVTYTSPEMVENHKRSLAMKQPVQPHAPSTYNGKPGVPGGNARGIIPNVMDPAQANAIASRQPNFAAMTPEQRQAWQEGEKRLQDKFKPAGFWGSMFGIPDGEYSNEAIARAGQTDFTGNLGDIRPGEPVKLPTPQANFLNQQIAAAKQTQEAMRNLGRGGGVSPLAGIAGPRNPNPHQPDLHMDRLPQRAAPMTGAEEHAAWLQANGINRPVTTPEQNLSRADQGMRAKGYVQIPGAGWVPRERAEQAGLLAGRTDTPVGTPSAMTGTGGVAPHLQAQVGANGAVSIVPKPTSFSPEIEARVASGDLTFDQAEKMMAGQSVPAGVAANVAPTGKPAWAPVKPFNTPAEVPRDYGRMLHEDSKSRNYNQLGWDRQAMAQGWRAKEYDRDTGAPVRGLSRFRPEINPDVARRVQHGTYVAEEMRPDVAGMFDQMEGVAPAPAAPAANDDSSPFSWMFGDDESLLGNATASTRAPAGAGRPASVAIPRNQQILASVGEGSPGIPTRRDVLLAPQRARRDERIQGSQDRTAERIQGYQDRMDARRTAQVPRGYAAGGFAPPGTTGMVGERGPELFRAHPDGGATITPLPGVPRPAVAPDPQEDFENQLAQAPAGVPGRRGNIYGRQAQALSDANRKRSEEQARRAQEARDAEAMGQMSPRERLGWARQNTLDQQQKSRDEIDRKRNEILDRNATTAETRANNEFTFNKTKYEEQTRHAKSTEERDMLHDAWAGKQQEIQLLLVQWEKSVDQETRALLGKEIAAKRAEASDLWARMFPGLATGTAGTATTTPAATPKSPIPIPAPKASPADVPSETRGAVTQRWADRAHAAIEAGDQDAFRAAYRILNPDLTPEQVEAETKLRFGVVERRNASEKSLAARREATQVAREEGWSTVPYEEKVRIWTNSHEVPPSRFIMDMGFPNYDAPPKSWGR